MFMSRIPENAVTQEKKKLHKRLCLTILGPLLF